MTPSELAEAIVAANKTLNHYAECTLHGVPLNSSERGAALTARALLATTTRLAACERVVDAAVEWQAARDAMDVDAELSAQEFEAIRRRYFETVHAMTLATRTLDALSARGAEGGEEEVSHHPRDYASGYRSGQHDALTWLSVPRDPDDHPMAAIDESVQFRAAMVCLASNLTVAAALLQAHLLGHTRGLFRPSGNDPCEVIDEYIRSTFRPGHALPTPPKAGSGGGE